MFRLKVDVHKIIHKYTRECKGKKKREESLKPQEILVDDILSL